MIISKLKLYDFRRFHSEDGRPGLSASFHKGLNAIIGENDSGKTAIIDALKLVLLTQSNDYIHPIEEDFYAFPDRTYANEFRIECVLSDFAQNEAKNFIEYLSIEKNDSKIDYSMQLFYRAWKEKNRIFTDLRVGDPNDGITLDNRARELLKVVYLRPLRDAEREMRSGRNSRLSQILLSHKIFRDKDGHPLKEIMKAANRDIEKYFSEQEGQEILRVIRSNLTEFNDGSTSSKASLSATDVQLKSILESLSLVSPELHPGLGEQNLVFIAAELLLMKQDDVGGLKLALIEELEAHLHPQAQLRLVSYLQREYDESGAQIIISTHSSNLASKINLKNIILLKNGCAYDLSEGNTGLEKGDYLFLQRFLDATKGNLFFAKGLILVEGDAENLLIPAIADIIGYPLERYGVSIVNVGSTAFLRYSRIFIRGDLTNTIDIPVSVITDCDVSPLYVGIETGEQQFNERISESAQAVAAKKKKYSFGSIQGFVSPRWTLEYCIALSSICDEFHHAINYAKKIRNSDKYTLTSSKISEADKITADEQSRWASHSKSERAYEVYDLMLREDGKSGLKTIVAQCLASLLRLEILSDSIKKENMFDIDLYQTVVDEYKKGELKLRLENDPYLSYLVLAIKHAVGVYPTINVHQEDQADGTY